MSQSNLSLPNPRANAGRYLLESSSDRDRLYIQFDLWRDDVREMFKRTLQLGGLSTEAETASFRLLDVGCGEGLVSADILECYPQARAVGLDRDAEATETGRIGYEHLPNLHIYTRDVHEPFPEEFEPGVGGTAGEGFDIALFRFALTHFTDGLKVMRNVYSALKPGGVVLLFDPTATTYFDFPHPSFKALGQLLNATWKYVGTFDAGNRQAELLREAGFEILESGPRQFEAGNQNEQTQTMLSLAILTLASVRRGLVERARMISAEDFDQHIERLKTEAPAQSGTFSFHQTIARKPR